MSVNKPLLERILEKEKKEFPTFFSELELKNNPMRDEWMKEECYCPITVALQHVLSRQKGKDWRRATNQDYMQASLLAAMMGWKQGKEIYEFDPDLSIELLRQSSDNLQITSDMVKLPSWSVYMELPGADITGVIVFFNWTPVAKTLCMLPIFDDGKNYCVHSPVFMPIPKTPKTIDELMAEISANWLFALRQSGRMPNTDIERAFAERKHLIKFVINALAYLTAVNGDVVLKKGLPKGAKKSQTFTPVKEYKVGESMGMRLKEFHKASITYLKSEEHEHHRTPVMHIRRAHWHTYLKGKGRKEKELKWQLPIVVNGNGKEIDVVSLVKVKNEEENKE